MKQTSFPIFGILGLIFITLKLAGIGIVATWSWWWVLAPFWLPLSIAAFVFLAAFMTYALFSK